ncbi:MAG: hypothetical protein GWP14_00715 [Actinobacteria bacterium]|nr:hypothetical protein [Actinomycetota bacterium]
MIEQTRPLTSRSVQEQALYLLVMPCGKCQAGPLVEISRRQSDGAAGESDVVETRCCSCGQETALHFLRQTKVRATARSTLIDVTEWLGLCHHFLDLGQTESDEEQTQQQIKLARYCLGEALKFYPEDSDLPEASAFFGRLGNQRLKEHPATFLKTRLLELRRQLPALALEPSKAEPTEARKKRKWWRV